MTDENWHKTKNIKIKQGIMESLDVSLKQNVWESLNVNLGNWILTNSSISNNRWEPLNIKIDESNNYLYLASIEARIAWKSLLTLWFIWILYWNWVRISSFFWTNISDTEQFVGWILVISLLIELLLFLIIFYRDLIKYKSRNRKIELQNLTRMKQMYQRSAKILAQSEINKIERDRWKQEKTDIEIEEIKNNIAELKNEGIHKNIIIFWFQTFYPLLIWILWLKYLFTDENHFKIIEKFNSYDLTIAIMLWVLFYGSIYVIFKTKKIDYKTTR